ncbi:hypothetical protein [Nitrospira sp. Nam74]
MAMKLNKRAIDHAKHRFKDDKVVFDEGVHGANANLRGRKKMSLSSSTDGMHTPGGIGHQ